MNFLTLLPLLVAADADEGLGKKMLPIYVKEVEQYSLAVESAPNRPLELKKEPVFEWLNPARNSQYGALFLWLRDNRPAAIACIFSGQRPMNTRQVMHELHALDAEKLLVKRDEYNQWKPQAGLARKELTDAPAPAATAGTRLVQMRRLAQEFTGHSIDRDGRRWELRLLSTPLYRYPSARSSVVDGAIFALMSTAGTDPEVLLVIEARESDGKLRWEFACGRFSDWELHVHRKDNEVFTSIPGANNPFAHDPLHLYRIYGEKIITMEGKVLSRIRQTPTGQQVIPVEDK